MGLFDKFFGGKKADQPADTTNDTNTGSVNAPLNAGSDTQADGTATTGTPPVTTTATAPDTSVEISEDGEFSAPPQPVSTDASAEPAVTVPTDLVGAATGTDQVTDPEEAVPGEQPQAENPVSDEEKTV